MEAGSRRNMGSQVGARVNHVCLGPIGMFPTLGPIERGREALGHSVMLGLYWICRVVVGLVV
jgi:hypothetical protein